MKKKYINPKHKLAYAIQHHFVYGWDYVGSDENGDRLLFDTHREAIADLQGDMKELKKLGNSPKDWRVVRYNPDDDDKSDL